MVVTPDLAQPLLVVIDLLTVPPGGHDLHQDLPQKQADLLLSRCTSPVPDLPQELADLPPPAGLQQRPQALLDPQGGQPSPAIFLFTLRDPWLLSAAASPAPCFQGPF